MKEVLDKFTPGAMTAIQLAGEVAEEYGHDYVGTEHLLVALARRPGTAANVILRNVADRSVEDEFIMLFASGTGTSV